MKEPDSHEMDCLERLAHDQSGVIPPCAGNLLLQLESLGLIEKSPRIWLATQLIRNTYRLTPAGRALLHKHRLQQGKKV
jgi:DNA-binding PadR family transcriptional regulator